MPTSVALATVAHAVFASTPPGRGPFGSVWLPQPVTGAPRGVPGGSTGKLCNISSAPYSVSNGTNATAALQSAIDDCGDSPTGGTVVSVTFFHHHTFNKLVNVLLITRSM